MLFTFTMQNAFESKIAPYDYVITYLIPHPYKQISHPRLRTAVLLIWFILWLTNKLLVVHMLL